MILNFELLELSYNTDHLVVIEKYITWVDAISYYRSLYIILLNDVSKNVYT